VVLGLDCAAPKLIFDRLRDDLPHLQALIARGRHGRLRSSVPPITVPAWSCMFSGRDAGELGLYGFRNRLPGSRALKIASSDDVRHPRLWDRAAEAGLRSAVLFVPPTYPPPTVKGALVSCMLTPGADRVHTCPPELGAELQTRFGPYRMDVEGFRTHDRERVLRELRAMTEQHFAIARHVYRTRRPELMVMVEIGPDRLHHGFWHALDADHPAHDPADPLCEAARGYYRALDAHVGALLSELDDDTVVLVVSDHGARPLRGGVAVNEWLLRRGDLALTRPVETITPPSELPVDWSRTRAWAEGGYYARICLNVRGREPDGCVPPERFEQERDALIADLQALSGPDGEPLQHRVLRPEDTFRACEGQPPDILAFLGDLDYRAIGSLGLGRMYVTENDTGADSCNHDWDGIFIAAGPGIAPGDPVKGYTLYDVNRTVLSLLNIPCEDDLLGHDRTPELMDGRAAST
jgi:predicted AlkP superfamily phosphohydrolase/phosphomutase